MGSSTDTVETEAGSLGPDGNAAALPLGPFLFSADRLRQMEKQRSAALSAAASEASSAPRGQRVSASKKQGTSQYRGVNLHRRSCRWDAHAWHERQVHLGCFDHEVQAAVAYDIAALKLKGTRAKLNFDFSNYTDELAYLQTLPFGEVVAALRSSRRQLLTISRLKTGPSVREVNRPPTRTPSPADEPPVKRHRPQPSSKPESPSTSYTSHQSPHHPPADPSVDPRKATHPTHPTAPHATIPISYLPISYTHLASAAHPASHLAYFTSSAPQQGAAPPTLFFCGPPPAAQAPHQVPIMIRYHQPAPQYPPVGTPHHYPTHAPTYIFGTSPSTATEGFLSVGSRPVSAYSASDSLLLQASRARSMRLREVAPDAHLRRPASPTHLVTRPSAVHYSTMDAATPRVAPSALHGQDPHPAPDGLPSARGPCLVVYNPQTTLLPSEGRPDCRASAAVAATPAAPTYIPVQRLQLPPGLRVL